MSRRRTPIPPHARMVFKGILFEVWQWEQKMFDGSTETFERLKRPHTAQIIATFGGRILTLKEEQPDSEGIFVSIPGGRVDEGEEPLAGAQRELREETGYESNDWQLWFEIDPASKIEWTVYTLIARNCRKVTEPHLDAGERISTAFVSFDEFLALSDDEGFYAKEIVERLLRARANESEKSRLRKLFFGEAHA